MAASETLARVKAKKIIPHFPFVLNIKTNDEVKIFVSRLFVCFFFQHQKTIALHLQLSHLLLRSLKMSQIHKLFCY